MALWLSIILFADCREPSPGIQSVLMKQPPRLRVEPRPSRIACASLVAACSAAAVLLVLLPLPLIAMVAGTVLIVAIFVAGWRRCTGRGVPALLHVGIDRRITVTDRNGRSLAGPVLDDSYVGAFVTTIVWCADGDPWWRPARTMLILSDTLPRDEFRRLRVVLRYGRPPVAVETSGTDAA